MTQTHCLSNTREFDWAGPSKPYASYSMEKKRWCPQKEEARKTGQGKTEKYTLGFIFDITIMNLN